MPSIRFAAGNPVRSPGPVRTRYALRDARRSLDPGDRWFGGRGRELGARIPGATLGLIDGIGHDLPKQLWPRFFAGIAGPAAPA